MAALDPTAQVTSQLTPTADVSTEPNVNDVANFTYGDASLGSYLNQKYNYQLAPNPYQQQLQAQSDRYAGAIPAVDAATMFPSNQDINKGSYQGSIVGNVPIYAPSHLVPFGVFDAKQRALQAAALQKQQDAADFYKAYKAPITKRFAVQGELNDTFTDGMDKWIQNAQKQYGTNWASYLKQDQGFNNWVQSMQTAAQYEDGIVDKVSEIQGLIKSGDFDASPQLIKGMSDVMDGMGGLENPFDPKGHALGSNLLRMQADYDVDKAVNTEMDKLIQDTYETNPGITSQGIYDLLTSTTTTGTDKTKLDLLADGLYKTRYASSDYITRDDLYNRLYAKLGKSVTRKYSEQANQFSGASGAEQVYDPNIINPEGIRAEYAGSEGGVLTYDGQTLDKPIVLNIPTEVGAFDPKTGQPLQMPANSNVTIGKTFNILVRNDGVPVKNNVVPPGDDPQYYHYETYAAGSVKKGTQTTQGGDLTSPTSTTAPVEQTVWVPVKGIQNGLTTFNADGSYKKGVRTDVQSTNALARTNQLRAAAPATTSAAPQATTQSDFNTQWAALPSGGTLVGPDGVTYTKK